MNERPNDIDIVETGDGSKTLHDRDRDLHYRSTHGARQESNHVFVQGTGLAEVTPPWTVLELGFGAAVNFTGTVSTLPPDGRLTYHAVEYAPVEPEYVGFHRGLGGDMAEEALRGVRLGDEEVIVVSEDRRVELHLHLVEWTHFDVDDLAADAVYFDPFGPRSEPASWTARCFDVAREHMRPDAVLGTYSAASDVKRAMFEAGLHVATAPGPGRKREVTFASPSREALQSYELLSRDRYLDPT
jgi:tRNA U34 5-methylaminomethyl-2-thiouridine-forming methyltransferase MnmC